MSGVPGNVGCIPNTFQFLFDQMANTTDVEYLIKGSYLEIYNEKVRDLITNKIDLKVCETKEKGVWVQGLTDHIC